MPISRSIAKEQLERFVDYPGYPETTRGLTDLLDALVDASISTRHAEQIGNYLVRTSSRRCPLPANIYEAAEKLAEEHRYDRSEKHCTHCQDTGWISTNRGAVRCACIKPEAEAVKAGGR